MANLPSWESPLLQVILLVSSALLFLTLLILSCQSLLPEEMNLTNLKLWVAKSVKFIRKLDLRDCGLVLPQES
jgi:hypothetical protein